MKDQGSLCEGKSVAVFLVWPLPEHSECSHPQWLHLEETTPMALSGKPPARPGKPQRAGCVTASLHFV